MEAFDSSFFKEFSVEESINSAYYAIRVLKHRSDAGYQGLALSFSEPGTTKTETTLVRAILMAIILIEGKTISGLDDTVSEAFILAIEEAVRKRVRAERGPVSLGQGLLKKLRQPSPTKPDSRPTIKAKPSAQGSKKKNKKTAMIKCRSGKIFWTTQKQFWEWVREGTISKTGDQPLQGWFAGAFTELLVTLSRKVFPPPLSQTSKRPQKRFIN